MLTPSLLKTALRDLLRRPWQSGLMILGVALGVAVVIAIDLANTSATRAFDLSTQAVTGKTTHQIVGSTSTSAGIPQDLYRQVRAEWGYRQSAPIVEGLGLAPDLDGQPIRILGVDTFAEAPFRDYFGGDDRFDSDLTDFYTDRNVVLIGPGLADRYQLQIGDSFRVQINDRFESLRIVGILQPGDEGNRRALDGMALMDVGAAQSLLQMGDRLSRIDLILTEAESRALADRLPTNVRQQPASAQADTIAQLTAAFQLNLTALSLLALVVGMFLIYNTIMFSVVQRRQVFGILRSLGVTEPQLFALILFEAAVVALIGGAFGVGLGWLLGQGAVRLVTQTINDLYFALSVRDAPLDGWSVLKGLGIGVGASLLAAAAPAWEAASVPPITMTQRSAFEERARRLLPWLGLAGMALCAFGAVLLWATDSVAASFGGLFAIVIGLSLIVPIATAWLMRIFGPLGKRAFGVLGELAARTVTKAISRTSVAIAALMVAVSVTIGVSVMIGSFRSTLINWLDLTLVADIYISPPVIGGSQNTITVSPDLRERVARVPGVESVETIRTVSVSDSVGLISLVVADSQSRRSAGLYRYASGDPQQIWDEMNRADVVIVSEPFALRRELPLTGSAITLQTDSGPRAFRVIGVYYDYASDQGRVLMSRAIYERHWNDRAISGVAAYAAPGADVNTLAGALRAELDGTALQVQVNRALREQALVVFDRTFAITDALRLLAVLVAFIGVLSALMALQLERARELATLQALGLTAGQLWRLTFLETGMMGLTAGLFSLPTGFILAVVLIYVINLRSFGWTITMELGWPVFAQAMLVSVLAAVLAAIYPMRRLLQSSIAAALRQE
ncbi:MAG: FtsX-like permease family protein [Anaerolineales bacterium]